MPPTSSCFTPLNVPPSEMPEWMDSFTLSAPPNTDLWRKPPARDTSTAPILYTALRNPFVSAEVTVSADWELEWDQGGLVIFAGAPPGRSTGSNQDGPPARSATAPGAGNIPGSGDGNGRAVAREGPERTAGGGEREGSGQSVQSSLEELLGQREQDAGQQQQQQQPPPPYSPPAPASKWVKVGLEFCNNACNATSVCATADGADWSSSALPASHARARRADLRLKLERIGYALWVWYEDVEMAAGATAGGTAHAWKKLREVTWFFWGVEDKAVRVGVYASRPANIGPTAYRERGVGRGAPSVTQRNLRVEFEGLEIF
ncbi:hypothetical protein BDY21DRAFT_394219 [Lineolata rhizophorae]|uniref:Uncharacterized protein n=1 Tax=Lineolata rhizophorae TaxID=578093 RepID=A0A6A6NXX8_9PEZI|nr:hypothetical protein BDY21DRAFT_394219 [Lineolata rhizophorae]